MLIICYLPLLSMGTIALLAVCRHGNGRQRNRTCRKLDLHPSMYDNAVHVNAAVQSNVLNYNVAVRCCHRPTSAYSDVHTVNGA